MIEAIMPPDVLVAWRARPVVGIFPGEGIGPEVIGAATVVLDAVESASGIRIERITADTLPRGGESAITHAAGSFFQDVFERHGAVLCGPLGGRCVYDLRRRFDLFCKLAPIQPLHALQTATRLKPEILHHVGLVVVRDNAGGVYQGRWGEQAADQERIAEHWFSYSQSQVERIVGVGVRLAQAGRGRMHVVIKDGGVPAMSALWRDVALAAAAAAGVTCVLINADFAAYQLIQHPADFQVLVTPNLMGDILADLAAVLLGSRGMSFSGNFAADGRAVYQTGHGAANDLAGTDRANPLAQMLSLAMLLRESLGLEACATRLERAVNDVLRAGWRTADLAEPGTRVAGTKHMGELVARAVTKGAS